MIDQANNFGLHFESHFLDSVQPDPGGRTHNERTGIYRARGELIRNIAGPVHRTVKQRWDADAHKYRKKGKALKNLLRSVGDSWDNITIVD